MGCFQENLVAYKIQYFLNFGGLGASSPFLHVFGRQLGLSQVAVGWVFALAPFLDMFCKPLICGWADRRHAARPVFLALLSATTVALTCVVFVPPLPATANGTDAAGAANASDAAVVLDAGNYTDEGGAGSDLHHFQFWLYAGLVLLAWIGVSTNQSMADGMTAKVAESVGGDFGRQRLWGTIGLSTMSTLSGYLIELTSSGDSPNYSIGFYICGVFMSLDVILCVLFFKIPPVPKRRTRWTEMAAALRHWRVLCFSACCTALGVCTGLLWSFQFWYLDDLAKAAGYAPSRVQLLEGLTLLVKGLGCQIPLMFVSGAVLRRIGHRASMTLSMCSIGLHFVLYSQLVDPWYCLFIEPLAGAAYGLLYPAIASYACSIAPAGTVVTTQAIMAASHDGLGVGVGTLLSSYVFSRFGGSVAFLSFGASALAVAAVYLATTVLADRCVSDDTEPVITYVEDDAAEETPSQAVFLTDDDTAEGLP